MDPPQSGIDPTTSLNHVDVVDVPSSTAQIISKIANSALRGQTSQCLLSQLLIESFASPSLAVVSTDSASTILQWVLNRMPGFLGTALLSGIIKSVTGTSHDLRFSVTASSDASLDRLRQTFASNHDHVQTITSDNVKAVVDSEVVMLGFQPYQLTAISSHKALLEALQGKLIVSLLAGVSAQQIREAIYPFSGTISSNRISRVIPSIGAKINESVTLIADTGLSSSDQDVVEWLFEQVGNSQLVPENLIDSVTALSATCHSLTVVAADAIVDASLAEGIPRQVALAVAAQCLRSSSSLLRGQETIESLKVAMAVPRSITVNALLQLERSQVRAGISDTLRHAVRYSQTMSEKN